MSSAIQDRRVHAQAELVSHIGNSSADTASSLWNGLATLRKLLLTRLHSDVENEFGIDSALAPATTAEAIREMRQAAEEIEAYSFVVVIDEVARSGYVKGDANWFRDWLLRLRFGSEPDQAVATRIE